MSPRLEKPNILSSPPYKNFRLAPEHWATNRSRKSPKHSLDVFAGKAILIFLPASFKNHAVVKKWSTYSFFVSWINVTCTDRLVLWNQSFSNVGPGIRDSEKTHRSIERVKVRDRNGELGLVGRTSYGLGVGTLAHARKGWMRKDGIFRPPIDEVSYTHQELTLCSSSWIIIMHHYHQSWYDNHAHDSLKKSRCFVN